MFRLWFLSLLVFEALACAPVAASAEDVLRVATYNIRNHLCMDRLLEDGFRRDYPKPESEKAVVIDTILAVAPDVLVLQELGGPLYLEELQADLWRAGLEYSGKAIVEAADEERHVGALWREEVAITPIAHADLEFSYWGESYAVKRGMLELVVHDKKGQSWASLFGLHLKSKYMTDPRDPMSEERRVGEARAARNRILERYPEPSTARFLVLGDLNDGPFSRALQRFKTKGELRISRVLDSRDGYGLMWTYFYRKGGTYSQIDHILASEGWTALHDLTARIETRDDYYEGSDHRLVWLDIPIKDGVRDRAE